LLQHEKDDDDVKDAFMTGCVLASVFYRMWVEVWKIKERLEFNRIKVVLRHSEN